MAMTVEAILKLKHSSTEVNGINPKMRASAV